MIGSIIEVIATGEKYVVIGQTMTKLWDAPNDTNYYPALIVADEQGKMKVYRIEECRCQLSCEYKERLSQAKQIRTVEDLYSHYNPFRRTSSNK